MRIRSHSNAEIAVPPAGGLLGRIGFHRSAIRLTNHSGKSTISLVGLYPDCDFAAAAVSSAAAAFTPETMQPFQRRKEHIMRTLALLLTAASSAAVAQQATESVLTTADGRSVSVMIHSPEAAKQNRPVLIIAPGQGYHRERPLVKDLAIAAAKKGYVAIRFNWEYCKFDAAAGKCTGDASMDLVPETEDLMTVVRYAKSLPNVNSNQIILAGKSLGSLVGHTVFAKDKSLKGFVLMTPVCTGEDSAGKPVPAGEANYSGLLEETRPVVLVKGNTDPSCETGMMYDWLRAAKQPIPAVVLGGDHSMNLLKPGSTSTADRMNSKNVNAAIVAIMNWVGILSAN